MKIIPALPYTAESHLTAFTAEGRSDWHAQFSLACQPSEPMLRQREEWIRFSYSNEHTKDEEERKGWVADRTTKCGAKRQARTPSQDHATAIFVLRDMISHILSGQNNENGAYGSPISVLGGTRKVTSRFAEVLIESSFIYKDRDGVPHVVDIACSLRVEAIPNTLSI